MRVILGALAALLTLTGCSNIPGIGGNASPTPSASAAPQLDTEVPMPAGFPPDIPIYPRARLTAAASFTSTGHVTWGMEWETADDSGKVHAYYTRQLSQGDWTLTVNSSASGAGYAASFARKSNPHEAGTLAISSQPGVTTIALSFLSTS